MEAATRKWVLSSWMGDVIPFPGGQLVLPYSVPVFPVSFLPSFPRVAVLSVLSWSRLMLRKKGQSRL